MFFEVPYPAYYVKIMLKITHTAYGNFSRSTTGYLEKPVSLVFRGTLRDLSIGVGGLTINGLRYS